MNILLLWHNTETRHSGILIKGDKMLAALGTLTAR